MSRLLPAGENEGFMEVTPPFGQEVIREILPHRPPFLMVDRVEELEPDRRIVCVKSLSEDEYYLRRTRDGDGVLFPTTLLAEVMAQAGAMLVLLRPGLEGRPIYFMSIDNFELERPLRPGETVTIEAETVRMRTRFGTLRGTASVGSEQVARGVMRFAMDVPQTSQSAGPFSTSSSP